MSLTGLLPLRRHQIAWLSDAGWRGVLNGDWATEARACLAHWAAHRLPLVVTRQAGSIEAGSIALGLPAPGCFGRQRLAATVARGAVLYFDEFPLAERALGLLPGAARPPWRDLCAALKATGAVSRVYGSYGWQLMSGLDHVHAGSDIDLWLSVSDADQADAVAACLQRFAVQAPRLDGELMFDDGAAVAWREWRVWRAGATTALLVKGIDGPSLQRLPGWPGRQAVRAAA